jgi:hypothetical protein
MKNSIKIQKIAVAAFLAFLLLGYIALEISITNYAYQQAEYQRLRKVQLQHDYATNVPQLILESNFTIQKETTIMDIGTMLPLQYGFSDNASVHTFLSDARSMNATVIHFRVIFYFEYVYVPDAPPMCYTVMNMEWQPRQVTAYYFLYNDSNFLLPRVVMLTPP